MLIQLNLNLKIALCETLGHLCLLENDDDTDSVSLIVTLI